MTHTDWAAVIAAEFAVPDGLDVVFAMPELLGLLASPDPAVRDAQGYAVLSEWLEVGHLDAVLDDLGQRCAERLGNSSVLTRSFAALILAETLNRHARLNVQTGLPQQALDAWRAWYPTEIDVRSFEPGTGWIHAVAHGADTARALARHPQLGAADVRTVLHTLTARLRSLPLHLTQGEDDRLALAMLAACSRPELTVTDLQSWLADYRTLWTDLEPGQIPPGAALAVHTLSSLHTLLSLGCVLGGKELAPAHPAETLTAVQDALRSVYPYYGAG